jgi:hypothetical protein
MTTEMEDLRDVLRARAEVDTDGGELLARIRPGYRRRRTNRTLGTIAATVMVTGLVALTASHYLPGGYAVPGPLAAQNPTPDPAAIGSDPQTIHFGVGDFSYPVRTTTWSVRDGIERLSLWGNTVTFNDPHMHDDTEFFADLTLAPVTTSAVPDPTTQPGTPSPSRTWQATIAGLPALVLTGDDPNSSLAVTRVTWQPMGGVRAELAIRGPVPTEKVLEFARSLRLDVIHRCVLRVRPTTLPSGAHVTACSTMADSLAGELTVGSAQGTITISVANLAVFDPGATSGASAAPSRQLRTLANGWPYEQLDPSRNTQNLTALIRVPDPYLEIWSQGGYGLPDVLLVAGGLELSSKAK